VQTCAPEFVCLKPTCLKANPPSNVAREQDWWAGGRPAPVEAWQQYRPALAGQFTRAEWQVIALAISSIGKLWAVFEMQLTIQGTPEGTKLTDTGREALTGASELHGAAGIEPAELKWPLRRYRSLETVYGLLATGEAPAKNATHIVPARISSLGRSPERASRERGRISRPGGTGPAPSAGTDTF
jgi:hypothetical protein